MSCKNASQKSHNLTRIVKENADILADFLFKSTNAAFRSSVFLNSSNLTTVTPLQKRGRKDSILPTLSKVFEILLLKYLRSLAIFFQNTNSNFGNAIVQHWRLTMLEKWKKYVDKGKVFGWLLTDLSKTFDCLNHELPIAKLNPDGFNLPA